MRVTRVVAMGLVCVLVWGSICWSEVPNLISFQGRLTNASGTPLAGTYSVQFTLHTAASGGGGIWNETQSVTSDANGLFSTLLGSVTTIPVEYFPVTELYLGIKVGADAELTPRTRLATVPHAYSVGTVNAASGGYITSSVQVDGPLRSRTYGNDWAAIEATASLYNGFARRGLYAIAQGSTVHNMAVYGQATDAYGSPANSAGIYGVGISNSGGTIWAGYFDGWANVTGTFFAGAKSFRIDDPTDPANSTLTHACVESNEYKNVYDGVATADANGAATVTLPSWFGSLNGDFRYQLTCIGGFAPVYIAKEISGDQFTIAGGTAGMRISWQVTGVRKDAYATAHPVEVQKAKPAELRGKYLHPKEHGASEELGVDFAARQAKAEVETPERGTQIELPVLVK